MRQTLLYGGLECISYNTNRQIPDLKFFEYGSCYYYDSNKKTDISELTPSRETSKEILRPYSEDFHLAIWITGKRIKGSWVHTDEDASIYELKSYIMNILYRLGVPMGALIFNEVNNDIYSKGQQINNRNGNTIVEYGIVSKKQTSKFDISVPVYYADINWNSLMKIIKNTNIYYRDIPKYPSVSRDLALLLDKQIEFAEIERIAYMTDKKYLKDVSLFDVYEGNNLEEGKKSYAVNFVLQDDTKTLNDKQIEAIMKKLEENLCKQLNCKVRGK